MEKTARRCAEGKRRKEGNVRPPIRSPRRTLKRTGRLELVLGLLGLGALDGLHEAQAGGLDGGELLVLLGRELLVGVLELLDLVLEELLGLLELLLLLGDLGVEVGGGEGHEALDLLLLVVVAEVDVGGGADGLELLLGELLEGVKVAAALVVLEVGGVSVLDSRVSADAVGVAEGLAVGGAVNIADELGGAPGEFLHELVPIGFHFLTVASPRGLELDQNGLAGGFGFPILRIGRESSENTNVDKNGIGTRVVRMVWIRALIMVDWDTGSLWSLLVGPTSDVSGVVADRPHK